MVPLLTLTAYYAPPGHRATWFALMASLMNIAVVASQLQTKYLNDIFVVGRGQYAELGPLLIWAVTVGWRPRCRRPLRLARQGFLYSAAFHLLLGRIYDDKDVQERIVRRSKLDWVIVRPVILTNGPKTSAYRTLVDPRDWTCGFVSRTDVADFLVKQIDDDAFLHKTPGAHELTPLQSRSEFRHIVSNRQ
jgi:uncharacterized protein YbjT (DUF2867 family)